MFAGFYLAVTFAVLAAVFTLLKRAHGELTCRGRTRLCLAARRSSCLWPRRCDWCRLRVRCWWPW